jgi:fatty-acyl-CoA synthase
MTSKVLSTDAAYTSDEQLTVARLFEYGAGRFPDSRVVTATESGTAVRTFSETTARVECLAADLRRRGLVAGDVVASFATNTADHLELYFAAPADGLVLHTVNIRLSDGQIAEVVREGGAKLLLTDAELLSRVGKFAAPDLKLDWRRREEADPGQGAVESPARSWPELSENAPCMLCHTSGTSGRPRGVAYSHRGIYTHAGTLCQGEVYGLTEADVVMPVVPMFHAGAWGLPYAAWQSGADLILPGAHAGDASRLLDLIEDECVTFLAAVPTVWLRLLEEQRRNPRDVSSLRASVSGGAALPAALARAASETFGVDLWQGWGMTETGPLATISKVPPDAKEADSGARAQRLATQGRAVPGMRIKLRSVEDGTITEVVPGRSGEILARSPWTATRYIDGEPAADRFLDGWVRSGDIATVDEYGALRIVDRLKDLIKSGGEWISSLELESALVACPGVREAAVVGAQDDEWGERPVAFVVTEAESPSAHELKQALRDKVPRWWIPETFVFCQEIARTSVGKYDKRALREQLGR